MWHSRNSSLTSLDVVTPLCVENNTIFTQMLENKRPFVQDKRILCSPNSPWTPYSLLLLLKTIPIQWNLITVIRTFICFRFAMIYLYLIRDSFPFHCMFVQKLQLSTFKKMEALKYVGDIKIITLIKPYSYNVLKYILFYLNVWIRWYECCAMLLNQRY